MFFLWSCHHKNIEIHLLKDLTYTESHKSNSDSEEVFTLKNEFFVIVNPPKSKKDIKNTVKNYNKKTLSKEELKKYYGYSRIFYKETKNMPRDYNESIKGYFGHDRIGMHGDDVILLVKWSDYGKLEEYLFKNEL